jgi:hypothetical protein
MSMPDSDATAAAPSRPRWFTPALTVLACLAALAVFLHGAFIAAERNTDAAKGNQMAYLQYAFKLQDSGWTYKQERNRMPALPMILAPFYQKDTDLKEDFFPRAKVVCIALAALCLVGVAAGAVAALGWRSGLLLALVLAFTLYIFRAGYVQAEVLYYTGSGLAFIGALALLRRPGWKLALGLGVLLGLTHLVKASILPAVALTTVLVAARALLAWWKAPLPRPNIALALLPAVIVPVAYVATISPYLLNSKALYGHAFYNVNSTFYIWQSNFQESKAFSSKYNDRRAYPAAPPEEIPSARRYLTTTPPAQVWARFSQGFADQWENLTKWYGALKYLAGMLVLGVVLSFPLLRDGRWKAGLRDHAWEIFYSAAYLAGYFLLISFYSAIANGPRFTYTLYLPVLFLLFYWLTRLPEWRPAWFGKLRLPAWFGLRALGVVLLLLTLMRDTRVNLHDVLPKVYLGT